MRCSEELQPFYFCRVSLLYIIREKPAEMNSVAQKDHHTPYAPSNLLNKNAAGIMTITYLSREIHRDGYPLPKPSRAPEQVMETAEMINPRLMICRAVIPIVMVSTLSVNRPIKRFGTSHDSSIPSDMIPRFIVSAV